MRRYFVLYYQLGKMQYVHTDMINAKGYALMVIMSEHLPVLGSAAETAIAELGVGWEYVLRDPYEDRGVILAIVRYL